MKKRFIRNSTSLALITFVMIVAVTTSCQNDSSNPINSGTTASTPSSGRDTQVIASNWPELPYYTDLEWAAMHHNQIRRFVPQWGNQLQRGSFEEQILGNMDNWIKQSIHVCGFEGLNPSLYYYPEEYRQALERGWAILQIENPDQRLEQIRLWIAEAIQNARESQFVTPEYVDLLEYTFNEILDLLAVPEPLTPADIRYIAELIDTLRFSAQLPSERAVACVFWDSFQQNVRPLLSGEVPPGEMGLDNDPWVIIFDAAGSLVGLLLGPAGAIIGGAYVSVVYILT